MATIIGKHEALCDRCGGSGEVPLDPSIISEKQSAPAGDLLARAAQLPPARTDCGETIGRAR
jgi:hypothetical protein